MSLLGLNNNYSYESISKDLVHESVAVIRDHQQKVNILKSNLFSVEEKMVVTILNSKGDHHINYQKAYDDETSIKSLEAIVRDKNGVEIAKFRKRDFDDYGVGGSGVSITDTRIKRLEYKPISYPVTLEFYSLVESKNTGFLPSWDLAYGYYVGIESSSFEVRRSPEITINEDFVEGYLEVPVAIIRNEDLIEFSANDIRPLKYEDLAPKLGYLMPKLVLGLEKFYLHKNAGYANDWRTFGKWYYNNFLNQNFILNSDVIYEINLLTSDINDQIQKAKKIYEYVQSRTRYISIQLGIGGWKPSPAQEVHDFGYGDCKGLTHYTRALLNAVDIPAQVAIVNAGRDKRDISESITSMQGNHVILALPVDQDTFWLECTSQTSPFGFIGQFTDDRKVLLVSENGGEIVRTKKYGHTENVRKSYVDIEIALDGSLNAHVDINNRGVHYERSSLHLKGKKEEVEDFLLSKYSKLNRLSLTNLEGNINKDSIFFQESFDAYVPSYATVIGNEMIFNVLPFKEEVTKLTRYSDRTLPFSIRNGDTKIDEGLIILPSGYSVSDIPQEVLIQNEIGEYKLKFELNDGIVRYRRQLTIYDGIYSPEKYTDFRKFLREVNKKDRTKISISKQS